MKEPDFTDGFEPKAITDYRVVFGRYLENYATIHDKPWVLIASKLMLTIGIREDDIVEARRLFGVICHNDYNDWCLIDVMLESHVVPFEDDQHD